MKLAAFAAVGVAATHAIHLVLGGGIASRALTQEQEALGLDLAGLVAHQAADAVLVDDRVTLQEIVANAASSGSVAYCFIERDGTVLASSFQGVTPSGLLSLRRGSGGGPVVVRSGSTRILDLVVPILDGAAGTVRLGMDLAALEATRRELAALLGSVAVLAIALGFVAAFLVGRRIARPVGDLLAAADRFDPGVGAPPVLARGTDEFAELAMRFNQMMVRLRLAHDEQRRAAQNNAATERLAALGVLVAGVAHEVNNPLAGLKNVQRLLERKELPEAQRRECLVLMGEAISRAQAVVGRLLDFGRPRPLELRDEKPVELAREGESLVRLLLRERKIEWKEELGALPEDARVIADRSQVGQALLNLILNAAYVTPAGGQIRLRVKGRPAQWGLSVEDDGPGIPVEDRGRVMDPYFSTKPEGEGTGLGLSVARTIADAHGGELAFEFPERGTVATLWLRAAGRSP
ncbi:MAG: sensor histidine kinase [Myxococcaceae bacterium]